MLGFLGLRVVGPTCRVCPTKNAMVAVDAAGQGQGRNDVACGGANVELLVAFDKIERILIEAFLRLSASFIQVTQMECEVSQMIGSNEHINLNRSNTNVGLDYNTLSVFATVLIRPRLAQTIIITTQTTSTTVFSLLL